MVIIDCFLLWKVITLMADETESVAKLSKNELHNCGSGGVGGDALG